MATASRSVPRKPETGRIRLDLRISKNAIRTVSRLLRALEAQRAATAVQRARIRRACRYIRMIRIVRSSFSSKAPKSSTLHRCTCTLTCYTHMNPEIFHRLISSRLTETWRRITTRRCSKLRTTVRRHCES